MTEIDNRFKITGQCCGTCYYYALWDKDDEPLENQYCFRYPPLPRTREGQPVYSYFPSIPPESWCGEWRAKKESVGGVYGSATERLDATMKELEKAAINWRPNDRF